MPYLIRHIDAIARSEGRDVLLISFPELLSFDAAPETLPIRIQIIQWLKTAGIGWYPCAEIADENAMMDYQGSIYIAVPFDETNPDYRKLRDYLENPDGTMRFEGARFCYVPLAMAMKNAHHDEPGFWQKWAEDF